MVSSKKTAIEFTNTRMWNSCEIKPLVTYFVVLTLRWQ
jgi:hypothetical protein